MTEVERKSMGRGAKVISLRRELFKSYLLLAALGAATALAMLLFLSWNNNNIERLIQREVSAANASIEITDGIHKSTSSLSVWLNSKDPQYLDLWRSAWNDDIRPSLPNFVRFEPGSRGKRVTFIGELTHQLAYLEFVQWSIKERALAPDSSPGKALLEREAMSVLDNLDRALSGLYFMSEMRGIDTQDLSQTRERLARSLDALASFLEHHDPLAEYRFQQELASAKLHLSHYMEVPAIDEERALRDEAKRELLAYEKITRRVIVEDAAVQGDTARFLMNDIALHAADGVIRIISNMASEAGSDLQLNLEFTKRVVTVLFGLGLIAVLVLIAAAFLLPAYNARKVLAPIADLSRQTAAIAQGDNDTAVASSRVRELRPLTDSFNTLFQSLEHRERELKDSEAFFRAITETAVDPIISTSLEGVITSLNSAAVKTFGYSMSEAIGMDIQQLVPSKSGAGYSKFFQRQMESDKSRFLGSAREAIGRRKDGTTFPLQLSVNSFELDNGDIHLAGLCRDLTKEKAQAEAREKLLIEVEQSRKQLKELINSIDGMMWELQLRGDRRYTYVSDQARQILGISAETLMQDPAALQRCLLPEDRELWRQEIDDIIDAGEKRKMEYRVQMSDESVKYIQDIVTPIYEDDELIMLRGVSLDITKYRNLEQEQQMMSIQLQQAQKLEAVGSLAAGIAHEINTPTQFVGDNLQFFKDSFSDLDALLTHYEALIEQLKSKQDQDDDHLGLELDDPESPVAIIDDCREEIDIDFLRNDVPAALEESIDGISRISSIVKAMKDFSHPGNQSYDYIDLNRAVESTVTVARNEWKYIADVEMNLDPELPPVFCLPGEINQAILNIVVNAAHAVKEQSDVSAAAKMGTIKISTGNDGDYVKIVIQDSGVGISEENQSKIFDPFFTTKQVGEGTGQGLSLVHSVVVDKHKGKLEVQSELGKGTRFAVLLPNADPDQSREAS